MNFSPTFNVDFILIPELHIDIPLNHDLINWKFKFTEQAKSISSKLEETAKGKAKYLEQEEYIGKITRILN